jgi:hypothetical protein
LRASAAAAAAADVEVLLGNGVDGLLRLLSREQLPHVAAGAEAFLRETLWDAVESKAEMGAGRISFCAAGVSRGRLSAPHNRHRRVTVARLCSAAAPHVLHRSQGARGHTHAAPVGERAVDCEQAFGCAHEAMLGASNHIAGKAASAQWWRAAGR